jgi:putative chitinase
MFNQETIFSVFPNAKPDIVDALVNSQDLLAGDYGIDTPLKMAHFLAQTAHESGGFRLMEENLNYSSDRLMVVFPKYFRNVDARAYHRQPEKIANRVYANRMGNGDEASGDGYHFRGRGLIQLTGRNNYTLFAEENNLELDDAVNFLTSPEGAVQSAAWFWNRNDLNMLAEDDNLTAVTKRINGGTHGLEERKKYTNKFKDLLGA